MISRLRKRWLRPRTLGVLVAKLILSAATDLAAQTTPSDVWRNVYHATATNLNRHALSSQGLENPYMGRQPRTTEQVPKRG
jgi:hypothetical protein